MASIQNIEWLNQNMLRAYPIHEDSDMTPRLPDGSTAVGLKLPNCLLTDFTFTVPMEAVDDDTHVSLTGVSHMAGEVSLEFSIGDAVLCVVKAVLDDHEPNRAYMATGTGEFDDCAGWVVLGDLEKACDELPEGIYRFDPGQLTMEVSTLRMAPRGVRSLSAMSRFGGVQYARLHGNVRLIAGEDVELRVDKANNAIWMKAVSGSGYESGDQCDCEAVKRSYVRRINGMAVEEVEIVGSTCVKVTNDTANNTISLSDSCSQPCCGCAELNFVENAVATLERSLATLTSYGEDLSLRIEELYGNLRTTAESLTSYPNMPGGSEPDEEDLALEPLCITARSDDTGVSLLRRIATYGSKRVQAPAVSLWYSTDKENWTKIEVPPDDPTPDASGGVSQTSTRTFITLNAGEKVYIKGNNRTLGYCPDDKYGIGVGNNLLIDRESDVSGNVMSLLGRGTLTDKWCFANLFRSCAIVSAEDLLLPADTLTTGCYYRMFYGCDQMVRGPKFIGDWPVMTLGDYSCREMFSRCGRLEFDYTAEDYAGIMFQIKKAGAYACYQMFADCIAMSDVPVDFVQDAELGRWCYAMMFQGCATMRSPSTTPGGVFLLGSEKLADYCYQAMFSGCYALETYPSFNTHSPAPGCYNGMFKNCKSLKSVDVEADEAAINKYECCKEMFYGCSSLSHIGTHFKTWPAAGLQNWVYGVAETGMFSCSKYLSDERGPSAIPEGWTLARLINA